MEKDEDSMSTSHAYDAYLDSQPDEHFEPPYHEFEDAREEALKRQGAIEALEELKRFIVGRTINGLPTEENGLWQAYYMAEKHLRRLTKKAEKAERRTA